MKKPKAKPPKPKGDASSTPPSDREVEIERLAALDPVDYDVARAEAAERLNIRTQTLDRTVAKKRRALGLETGQDEDGQGRAVKIVDIMSWPEPVEGDRIATTLAATVKTYAVVPDTAADAIALWILHTWLVNEFTMSPRLAVASPTKGCGKTTVLRLLNLITRRPKRLGSISPPALFRAVEQFQPTILLDETEKYIEHGSDLHALLNEGHCKGASVMRVLGDKQELREFSVFGAAAFARNGRLPDDLEQRSIIIEMQRRRAGERLAELREGRSESLQQVARMCARWAEDYAGEVGDTDPDMAGIINRVRDNWRPLFTIAEVIGEDWPERIREAAEDLTPRDSESIGPMLLADIQAAFDTKGADRLPSADICEALNGLEGRPWADWKASDRASPKPLAPNQLARLLKPFRVAPDNLRLGSRIVKGYHRHQFEEAWQRYLASEGVSEPLHRYNADEIRTSATVQTATPESDVAVPTCEKPPSNGDCSGVAVQKGGNGAAGAYEAVLTGAEPMPADPFEPTSIVPEPAHSAPSTTANDDSIPNFLRRCAQCGAPGDAQGAVTEHEVGGARFRLHPQCHRFLLGRPEATQELIDRHPPIADLIKGEPSQ